MSVCPAVPPVNDDGELEDVVYRVDFAFAFVAFQPDATIVTE